MKKVFLLLFALITLTLCAHAQQRTVRGTVMSADSDEPLIGATVVPVGGGSGAATDIDGHFTLSIPASVKELRVSYVGMITATVPVSDQMVIRLQSADTRLDEVVVTGYGSAKKLGSIVGSVAVLGDQVLENIPTATFVDALQGQVAGLSIFSNSGDPSSVENAIRIRGVNSLNAGNTPLFILDGAPVTSAVFTTLNPNDIENITVLKDAASVAIYGSRAANGVIVITSKKGKFGDKAKVTLRANYGWSQMVADKVEMMDSKQYIEFRDKIGAPVSDGIRNLVDKYGISTNWREEFFDSSAPTYSVEGAITGGSDNLSYYISLNHYDAEGIIAQSGMRREALRANLSSRLNDWLRIGLQTNLGYTKYETNNEAGASSLYITNPMISARKAYPYDSPRYYTIDENGNINYGEKAMYLHYSGQTTPDYVRNGRSVWRNKLTINANLYEQLTPISGLVIRAQQAVDAMDYRLDNKSFPKETLYTPMGDVYTNGVAEGATATGANQQIFERYYSFTYTNTAEYTFTVADRHNFTALLGQESIITRDNSFQAYTTGQSDIRQMLLQQGTTATVANQKQTIDNSTFNSVFFNLNYDFDNRYYLDFTYRRDGSSKFAPGHRWANFFSVGGMWNAKAESFLQPVTWLDKLQLRVSYGTTGNSSIENYLYFGTVGSYGSGYGPESGPFQSPNISAIGISGASNHDLTWETVKSFDAGFTLGVFNRVTADFDFYHKTTTDMLMDIPWSFTTGFSSGYGNIGSMTNTGVDVTVRGDVVKTRDWYWGLRANFNYNKNKITELFNGRDHYTIPNTGLRYEIGHSAGEFYTVRYVGVDPRDGKQMWLDKNDNITKVYNEEENSVMTGKSQYAPWTGGFGTDVRWKGLGLQIDFNWAAKKYMTNNDAYFLRNAQQGTSFNQSVDMLNVWTKPGDVTIYPNASEEIQFDSRLIEDATFLRLKNLTVTYALPQNVLNKLYLQNLVFHFTGRNLLTFTGFEGYDPEPQTNVYKFAYPNTRQYEIGFEVTF